MTGFADTAGKILLIGALAAGVIAVPLGLSGTFLVLGIGVIYDLAHGFSVIGWPLHLLFLGLCVLGEVQETLLGSVVAHRFGAGRWGMLAAFAGGIGGAIVGSAVMPVVGTLIGSAAGAFAAAFGAEAAVRRRRPEATREGLRAGWGAFVGKMLSSTVKIAIGLGMAVTILVKAL